MAAANATTVAVPVELTVRPFSVARRSLRTFFGLSINSANRSNSAVALPSSGMAPASRGGEPRGDRNSFAVKYLTFMWKYRLAPQTLVPAVQGVGWDGTVATDRPRLADYLGAGQATTFDGRRFSFATAGMPDFQYRPSYLADPFGSTGSRLHAAKYYRSMAAALRLWGSKVVAYPIDEPTGEKRAFIERYGVLLRKYAPFAQYLLTVDPARFDYRSFSAVDIYVNKLHFWYRDRSRWIVPLRRRGKRVWAYTHATEHQGYTPGFLIDKPATDSRVIAWFAYETQAAGLLYESVNRWRAPATGATAYRNPYRDPLSARLRQTNGLVLANGSASLVYPGYYPPLGLDIPYSGPVSSLRMEALRDGLEDYEYLKLLERWKGRSVAMRHVRKLVGAVRPGRDGNPFPRYESSPAAYERVRAGLASAIARGL